MYVSKLGTNHTSSLFFINNILNNSTLHFYDSYLITNYIQLKIKFRT
jgi:hypothetical protein